MSSIQTASGAGFSEPGLITCSPFAVSKVSSGISSKALLPVTLAVRFSVESTAQWLIKGAIKSCLCFSSSALEEFLSFLNGGTNADEVVLSEVSKFTFFINGGIKVDFWERASLLSLRADTFVGVVFGRLVSL